MCEIPLGVDGHLYVLYSCTHTDIYWLDLSRRGCCCAAAAVPCAVWMIFGRVRDVLPGQRKYIYLKGRTTREVIGQRSAEKRPPPAHRPERKSERL